MAERATAFGTTIFAIDPAPSNVPPSVRECWDLDRLDDLCRMSNFLVIAAPVLDSTRNSIDARRIALMPEGSYVIVISRGQIVDEEALCDALESGHLAGAALDATAVEPLTEDSRLWTLPNVILTPHIGGATDGTVARHSRMMTEDIECFLEGRRPPRIVNPSVWEHNA